MYSLVRKILTIPIFCVLLSAVAPQASLAQSSASPGVLIDAASSVPSQQLLNERVVLDAGLFVLGTHTNASLNGQAGVINQEIDFDHVFGTGYDTQRFRFDGLWRITGRQHVRFLYFDNATSRTRSLETPIDWGNDEFMAGANVTARNRITVVSLSYEYAFIRNPTFELAASAGVHYTKASLKLSGMATLISSTGSSTGASFEDTQEGSVPAPLPVVGLSAAWAFSPHWILDGQAQVFDLSYDQFHGYWSDVRVGVSYLFNRHIGLGVGYDDFSTHLTVSKTNFSGRLNLGYRGGLVYITGAF
jgi:hypothetical protein